MKIRGSHIRIPTHIIVAISAWASKLTTAIAQFVSIGFLIKYLGLENYGYFTVLVSLSGWLALTDCGFGSAFQNTLSKYRATAVSLEGLLNQTRITQYVLFLIWLPLLIFLAFPISKHLFPGMLSSNENMTLAVLTGNIIWMINAVAGISYRILYAQQRGVLANLYPAIGSILSLASIAILTSNVSGKGNVVSALIAYSLPVAISAIAANNHAYPGLKVSIRKIDYQVLKTVIANSWRFWGFALLVAGVINIDYLIMARIIPPREIVTYTVVSRVFMLIYFIYYSLLSAIWPTFTELLTNGNYCDVKKEIKRILIYGVIIVSIGTSIFLMTRKIIAALLSSEHIDIPIRTILLFGAYYLFRLWGDAFAVALASVNKVKIFWLYIPFQAIISGGAQYFFGLQWGIDGIVLGISLSFFLTAVWINPTAFEHLVSQKRTL